MNTAPTFIFANVAALNICFVCGSDGGDSRIEDEHAGAKREQAAHDLARPKPTTPNVRLASECTSAIGVAMPHWPSRRCSAFGTTCRVVARMSASAWSATSFTH